MCYEPKMVSPAALYQAKVESIAAIRGFGSYDIADRVEYGTKRAGSK